MRGSATPLPRSTEQCTGEREGGGGGQGREQGERESDRQHPCKGNKSQPHEGERKISAEATHKGENMDVVGKCPFNEAAERRHWSSCT